MIRVTEFDGEGDREVSYVECWERPRRGLPFGRYRLEVDRREVWNLTWPVATLRWLRIDL